MPAKICLIGKQFGRLKVIEELPSIRNTRGTSARWNVCLCDCGTRIEVRSKALTSGNTSSCGCLHRELSKIRFTTHGHSRVAKATGKGFSPTYSTWVAMIARCSNPKSKYHFGRGISVCERWMKFENFLADMGDRPPGLSIDRINNDGNYEPDNCRWATPGQQRRNRRDNRIFTVRGITACAEDLERIFGVHHTTALSRIDNRGWSAEDAFTIKPRPSGQWHKASTSSQHPSSDCQSKNTLNFVQVDLALD